MKGRIHWLTVILVSLALSAFAQVRLPRLISDGMVLQRNVPVTIWGWASPGEEVRLTFAGKTISTQTDTDGNWKFILPLQEAGGPYEMVFEASNTVRVRNILFGDVWVCSGQSNMELMMSRAAPIYTDEIAHSKNDRIRQFLVPDRYDFKTEHDDLEEGSWVSADPQTVLGFTAVGYFFAKELYGEYQVPIGLINAALGGSPVEAWMSEEALKAFPDAYEELQTFKDDSLIARIERADQERSQNWYGRLDRQDQGLNASPPWSAPDVDDRSWATMQLPGYWADGPLGPVNGSVWFRREVEVPRRMAGKEASLWMGRIVDQDYVFVNGEQSGFTSYQYPPRRYTVDAGVLREGRNEIAVRVVNSAGRGGFVPDKPYYLAVGKDTIDLKGTWKYKLGTEMDPLPGQTFVRWKAGGLFKRMIAPLLNYRIKGVIWYQGESNANEPELYQDRFSAMIRDWRARWGQGEFPFLFVQLANFMEARDKPVDSNWAALRQAQLNTLSVPKTGMAVIIDLGEWNDIHPLNKEDVGKRLALLARKIAYGETEIHAFSPMPRKAEFGRHEVIVHFEHVGDGLVARGGGPLRQFALSADGKHFQWAHADIEGDRVRVWHEEIPEPVAVRYAWADNPEGANLYSAEGLPASPFELKKGQ